VPVEPPAPDKPKNQFPAAAPGIAARGQQVDVGVLRLTHKVDERDLLAKVLLEATAVSTVQIYPDARPCLIRCRWYGLDGRRRHARQRLAGCGRRRRLRLCRNTGGVDGNCNEQRREGPWSRHHTHGGAVVTHPQ
jgi:hypothetical protein